MIKSFISNYQKVSITKKLIKRIGKKDSFFQPTWEFVKFSETEKRRKILENFHKIYEFPCALFERDALNIIQFLCF